MFLTIKAQQRSYKLAKGVMAIEKVLQTIRGRRKRTMRSEIPFPAFPVKSENQSGNPQCT